MPAPTGFQLVLLMLLGAAEALATGTGLAFLVFGYPSLRTISPAPPDLTRAAHLAISWLLFNWWPHDNLHMHLNPGVNSLLARSLQSKVPSTRTRGGTF